MSEVSFCRFVLRTTDVPAAREFYQAVLGHDGDGIVDLPAVAIMRGAAPHWLGFLDVSDIGGVSFIASQLVARGASALGRPPGGDVTMRDPGGAVMALTEDPSVSKAGVIWHQLNTNDAPRACANYSELLGWSLGSEVDLGTFGKFQQFSWRAGEPIVGSIGDVADRPGVHTHWMFHFGVSDLPAALRTAAQRGAKIIGPTRLPSGLHVAVCDDPQGAAFGLMER